MKLKNKGKVFPSPSSSSSPSSLSFDYVPGGDFVSVLNLLPATILALASALSLEDREVLAYLILRSIASATPSANTPESKKKSSKRATGGGCGGGSGHNAPAFDCGCFDCYRSYWFRWDSSVNRELIHQAIEAFEDQLTCGEKSKKSSGRSKRRYRTVRREPEKPASSQNQDKQEIYESPVIAAQSGERTASSSSFSLVDADGAETGNASESEEIENPAKTIPESPAEELSEVSDIVQTPAPAANNGKGNGARKVLPDVLELINSRIWSLWSPRG